jgi:hypothetical protein
MAGDSEWLDEVRRWVLAGQPRPAGHRASESLPGKLPDDGDAIGYEAADPAAQHLVASPGNSTVPLPSR